MTGLAEHPLFKSIKILLEFMCSGNSNVEEITRLLIDLNDRLPRMRTEWVDKYGLQLEQYLETLAFYLISKIVFFFQKDDLPPTQVSEQQGNQKRRPNFPKSVVASLESWLHSHQNNPYPSTAEKLELCQELNLSLKQVNDWFINARRRKIKDN